MASDFEDIAMKLKGKLQSKKQRIEKLTKAFKEFQ